jgi:hypothetical protein
MNIDIYALNRKITLNVITENCIFWLMELVYAVAEGLSSWWSGSTDETDIVCSYMLQLHTSRQCSF